MTPSSPVMRHFNGLSHALTSASPEVLAHIHDPRYNLVNLRLRPSPKAKAYADALDLRALYGSAAFDTKDLLAGRSHFTTMLHMDRLRPEAYRRIGEALPEGAGKDHFIKAILLRAAFTAAAMDTRETLVILRVVMPEGRGVLHEDAADYRAVSVLRGGASYIAPNGLFTEQQGVNDFGRVDDSAIKPYLCRTRPWDLCIMKGINRESDPAHKALLHAEPFVPAEKDARLVLLIHGVRPPARYG